MVVKLSWCIVIKGKNSFILWFIYYVCFNIELKKDCLFFNYVII